MLHDDDNSCFVCFTKDASVPFAPLHRALSPPSIADHQSLTDSGLGLGLRPRFIARRFFFWLCVCFRFAVLVSPWFAGSCFYSVGLCSVLFCSFFRSGVRTIGR